MGKKKHNVQKPSTVCVWGLTDEWTNYRKIPKICPGAYIFQRPFLRGLYLEGLIHGGAYFRNFTVC